MEDSAVLSALQENWLVLTDHHFYYKCVYTHVNKTQNKDFPPLNTSVSYPRLRTNSYIGHMLQRVFRFPFFNSSPCSLDIFSKTCSEHAFPVELHRYTEAPKDSLETHTQTHKKTQLLCAWAAEPFLQVTRQHEMRTKFGLQIPGWLLG